MSINREYIKDWKIIESTSYYPIQSSTYVKSTTQYSLNYKPNYATDPARTLTGNYYNNSWLALSGTNKNQRFHIDVGTACIIDRIYYENTHNSGGDTNFGAKNFTLWGSNDADDFADLTYANDGTWTQITNLSQTYFDQHVAADTVDPKYINITGNVTAYKYYAFKFADNWGGSKMGLRRIVLQLYGSQMNVSDGQVYLQYLQNKSRAGSLTQKVVAYTHGAFPTYQKSYCGGVLTQDGSKIYMIPHIQTNSTVWHYIDVTSGAIVPYTHGIAENLGIGGYAGGVLAQNGKIYLVPFGHSTSNTWNYIDTDGSVKDYTHSVSCVEWAYWGGVLRPDGRIYLMPWYQSTATVWHYIDTTNDTVVAYTHGATCVEQAYVGGCLTPDGKIFMCPDAMYSSTNWHYIDTDGTVVAYTHLSASTSSCGATLGIDGNIYPAGGAYYFNTVTNSIVNMTANGSNFGVVAAPDGHIYYVPYGTGDDATWKYYDVAKKTMVSYSHGVTAVNEAYRGGVLAPNGRIYLMPWYQATATVWHYIETYPTEDISTVVATSPFFNKF